MDSFKFHWKDEEYLAESENLSIETARNIIELFEKDYTIPFVARYRGNLTGQLTPDKLQKAKATYERVKLMHVRAAKLIKKVSETTETIPHDLLSCIKNATSLEELEFLSSPFQKARRTLAEASKRLGLEPPAKALLEGTEEVQLESLVNTNQEGLKDVKKVELGIQHIIADIISKNPEVHGELEKIYSSNLVLLTSKFIGEKDEENSKYYLYRDFSCPVHTIRPHQTLAINRGESAKELRVKIVIPPLLWDDLKRFCEKKWLNSGKNSALRTSLLHNSVKDAIERLLGPLAIRRIRTKLNAEAENEAISVFALNLRQLLMTPPVNGYVVMGIDPGFVHGCKVAVVSRTGVPICHDIFFLDRKTEALRKLKRLILHNGCEKIALGNGKGCRETETLLSKLIGKGGFGDLNVQYTIIDEQGVSIYSCSAVAQEEFPGLDPKIIGAISIARRLQNPLSELVKLEPKHLGVGMYQHDVKTKNLVSTLEEIISECVSFVGVDINSASPYLLRRVAGLNSSKAEEIIKYRNQNCTFKCREDLMKVKGIKAKTFLQCAGFIRVIPATARCLKHAFCNNIQFNPLDETWIHPESYMDVQKIVELLGLSVNELGSEEFLKSMQKAAKFLKPEELAKNIGCSTLTIHLIIDVLQRPKDFDLRSTSQGPFFHKELKNLEELSPGQILQGVVRNVVSFGAFVDLGVGSNGLIHASNGGRDVSLNDRVLVSIISIIKSCPVKIDLKLHQLIK